MHHALVRLFSKQRQRVLHDYSNGMDADRIAANTQSLAGEAFTSQVSRGLRPAFFESAKDAINKVALRGVTKEVNSANLNIRAHTKAVDYAAYRSAELVGKKINDRGELVDNPNAAMAITDTNRDVIRESIRDAVALRWDADKLSDHLEDTGLFSDNRAMMIAQTEINRAQNAGMLEAGKQARSAGRKVSKNWILGPDSCEVCQGVADEYGDTDLDDTYESDYGDVDAPPLHPYCMCELELVEEDDEE